MESSEQRPQTLKELVSDLAMQADGPLPFSITAIALLIQLALSGCASPKLPENVLLSQASRVNHDLAKCGLIPQGQISQIEDTALTWSVTQNLISDGHNMDPNFNYLTRCDLNSGIVAVPNWGDCSFIAGLDDESSPKKATFVLDCAQSIAGN